LIEADLSLMGGSDVRWRGEGDPGIDWSRLAGDPSQLVSAQRNSWFLPPLKKPAFPAVRGRGAVAKASGQEVSVCCSSRGETLERQLAPSAPRPDHPRYYINRK